MGKFWSLSVCLGLWAGAVASEGWPLREGDVAFAPEALDARVRGNILRFYDDGQAEFYDDGRYTYTYANEGGTGYGYFDVRADGAICIDFVNGFARCDAYVTDASGRLVLITKAGDRFPIRP